MRNATEVFVGGHWRCQDSGLSCGNCQSCVLTSKLIQTTQWFLKAGESTKRKFTTGILTRCENSGILENIRNILKVTMGKDFTYARSRLKPGLHGDTSYCSSNRALDPRLLREEIAQTLDWFSHSSNWTKSNYLLGVLSLCDTELLHVLGNLTHVLLVREKILPTFRSSESDPEDEITSIPESHYSFRSDGNPDLELLICASSVYGAIDLSYGCQDDDTMETPVNTGHGSLTTVGDSRHREASKGCYGSTISGCDGGNASDTDSTYSDDPALMVVPRSAWSLAGVGRYRDFIRQLPVHIAKRILGLLDNSTLHNCLSVSQHWRYLTKEVQEEGCVKRLIENQAMVLQGNTKAVNPTYARFQEVLVAVRDEEKFMYHGDLSSRSWKGRAFEAVYTGVIAKTVQMEERNVFCGTYNILLLQSREDPWRVTHYGGGQLVAMGSKDRVVRLVDTVVQKEVLPAMHGHAGSIRALLLCEDRGLVISAGYDLTIRCWNLKTGACITLFRGHIGTINCLDLHGDRLVSGAKDCKVKVWDLKSGKCVESLKFKHQHPIMCVKITKSCVLSGCAKGLVKLWSLETGSLLKVMEAHKGSVRCLFIDEWHILSGGTDGQVLAWSANPGFKKCLMSYRHPMELLSVTYLYLRAITGCVDGKIRIFNFVTGDCIRVIRACGQNSPVLSIHVTENNMVVDTEGGVFLLQFAKVQWDYASSSEREVQETVSEVTEGNLRKHSNTHVRAERMAAIGSSNRKLHQHSSSPGVEAPALSHHSNSVSVANMQHAREIQQASMQPATWSQLQAYKRSRAYIDLQPEFMAKGPSALSSGRPLSRHSQDASQAPSMAASGTAAGPELRVGSSELSRSEKALLRRVRRRGAHHPATPERMLLTLGSSSQLCPPSEPVRTNTELNARVRDAWGSPPPPRSPPDPKADRRGLDPAPPTSKRTPRLGGVRSGLEAPSPPPLAEARVQPSDERMYKHSNVIYTPLMHLVSEPDPKPSPVPRGAAQSRQVHSCLTSPSGVKGRATPQPPRQKRPQTAVTPGTAARKVSAPTTPAQGDPITPPPLPPPRPPPLPPPRVLPCAPAGTKRKGRCVEFKSPPKTSHHNPLDPYRQRTDFQLRTDTQLQEYVRTLAQQACREQARARAEAERASRRKVTVWGVRARGLPHEDFTKEGQVYAPELGPDVYI